MYNTTMKQKYIDRFHTKYEKQKSGCWEWTAALQKGYGLYRFPGGSTAHRFSALIHGLDMSQPVVRHKCNNPKCVNPDHLATGTVQDNIDDKVKAQRQPRGETNGRAILTEEQVKEIRAKYVPWVYSTTKLANEYNVTSATIGYIIKRKVWKHI